VTQNNGVPQQAWYSWKRRCAELGVSELRELPAWIMSQKDVVQPILFRLCAGML
jgi:hypothetical protein